MKKFQEFRPVRLLVQMRFCMFYKNIASMYMTDSIITEAYLNRIYEDLLREQTATLNKMKKGSTEIKDFSKEITKEITLITDLMNRIIKFRTYREMMKAKQVA
jgi:hypothetical protein